MSFESACPTKIYLPRQSSPSATSFTFSIFISHLNIFYIYFSFKQTSTLICRPFSGGQSAFPFYSRGGTTQFGWLSEIFYVGLIARDIQGRRANKYECHNREELTYRVNILRGVRWTAWCKQNIGKDQQNSLFILKNICCDAGLDVYEQQRKDIEWNATKRVDMRNYIGFWLCL